MTREVSGEDTKAVQEVADEGETEVDEVVGKFIKRIKSHNIYSQIMVFVSYK